MLQLLSDNPARVAPPQGREDRRPEFLQNHPAEQLVALDRAVQVPLYREAVSEALANSDRSDELDRAIADMHVSNAALGALVRELVIAHCLAVAQFHADDFRRFL